MCGRFDFYLSAFSKLNIARNESSWPQVTHHSSPYKPFLLLSVLDHISTGRITRNFIEPSFELAQTFFSYIDHIPEIRQRASMSYPFYHLSSADFWKLLPQPGQKHRKGLAVSSMKRLRELYLGARVSEDLFPLLQMESSREKLRNTLITAYFAEELQAKLREQSLLNCESDRYSYTLMGTNEATYPYTVPPPKPVNKGKVRDQGFRKAIVQLYDHRCALCGIKMRTPEGHTVVDAAHIVPFSESHNDHPTNGMALCKLCHWSFDKGLMSVNRQYQVIISPAVQKDSNLPGHIMTLSDRLMFRPEQSRFWPAPEGFAWHRKECFRATTK